ncbi:MAG TPA: hypothetical protein VKO87_00845, partial [Gemmatimonadaceae bacterium]|nr:hypothetical protein [Gemmatimonadaceae bacterium]
KPIPDATPDFFLSNDQSYLLRGDGSAAFLEGSTSPYSGMSRYTDGQCGDHTELFNSPSTGSGDAILASPWATHSKCPSYPRGIRLTYALINADGSITGQGSAQVKTFVNVAQIQSPAVNGHPAFYIPVGSTELRGMNLQDDNGKCITLRFRPVLRDGTVAGADDVTVTRTAADTWIVRTQPDDVDALTGQVTHHDKAWCESSGNLYHLPTMFIIHNAVPLFP